MVVTVVVAGIDRVVVVVFVVTLIAVVVFVIVVVVAVVVDIVDLSVFLVVAAGLPVVVDDVTLIIL